GAARWLGLALRPDPAVDLGHDVSVLDRGRAGAGAADAGSDDFAPPHLRRGDDGQLCGDHGDVLVDVPAADLPAERARPWRDGGRAADAAAGACRRANDAGLWAAARSVRPEAGGP